MINFKQKFSTGDNIKVLSGIEPLFTKITRVKWNDKNKTYFYYFLDEEGKEWHEDESTIELV